MQYKIPVQIENEDPIILGLSLRQLMIILVFGGIGYSIFQGLSSTVEPAFAAIPAIIMLIIGILIAVPKISEMSFTEYLLASLRHWLNGKSREWVQGVDSFSALEIGYITTNTKKTEKVDFGDKIDRIKNIDDKIENL